MELITINQQKPLYSLEYINNNLNITLYTNEENFYHGQSVNLYINIEHLDDSKLYVIIPSADYLFNGNNFITYKKPNISLTVRCFKPTLTLLCVGVPYTCGKFPYKHIILKPKETTCVRGVIIAQFLDSFIDVIDNFLFKTFITNNTENIMICKHLDSLFYI